MDERMTAVGIMKIKRLQLESQQETKRQKACDLREQAAECEHEIEWLQESIDDIDAAIRKLESMAQEN